MRLRRLLSLLMAPIAISIAFAAAPAPASAATASCTTYRGFTVIGAPSLYFYAPTTASGTTNCLLGVGNQSDAVLVLQLDLDACYHNDGVNIATDGIFGPQTRNAVLIAQRVGKVTQDGVYGPVTRSHMWWGGIGTGYLCYYDGAKFI